LPKQLLTLIDHEDKAVAIHDFQSIIIHGLLQNAEYARALISASRNMPKDEIDDRVAARLARQALLTRRPLMRSEFFVHEFALRLPVVRPVVYLDTETLAFPNTPWLAFLERLRTA
jgi:hypothetical protein